jgi:NAD(P)H-dependent flavin oxidoreductase YrpB (nitropropane dioxygenase family)
MPDAPRTSGRESDSASAAGPDGDTKFGGGGVPAPLATRLTELLGIRYPIVQTGMGWVATPQLAAATSAAGGLGILAAATMSLDELRRSVKEVRERTDAPFGVNMRADQSDVVERVDLLIREGVRVASFAMAPKQDLIKRLHDGGVLVMPSIGAKRHAEKVAAWGVDAVLVQGGEGGGHTGSVPTTLLLPQVVDTVDVPVVAAGGFFDGRGLVAALSYGASGVAMGTRFLLTADSPVPEAVKQHYLSKSVTDTVVTRQVDGVPHRVLRSDLVDALEAAGPVRRFTGASRSALAFKKLSGTPWRDIVREGRAMLRSQELSWSQVLMAANTPMLLRAAMVDGRDDLGVMAAGQVVGLIDDLPTCDELVSGIVSQAHEVLAALPR